MPDFQARLRAMRSAERTPIRAEAPTVKGDATTAVLRLYDAIDSWGDVFGVSAKEFAQVLDDLPDSTTEIRLLINSPGGELYDALAILNSLRAHSARVVAVVEGIAASAASVIATGVDEMIMAPNSELMIHEAWGLVVGNSADMRQQADLLDHLSNNAASVYAAKSGAPVEEMRAAMVAETWYSADEAVAAGLADSVMASAKPEKADQAKARFDMSVYAHAGRVNAPAPKPPVALAAGSVTPTQEGTAVFTDEQLTTLRNSLGVAADADAPTVLAALNEALAEQTQETAPAVVPDGMVLVPQAVLDTLQSTSKQTSQIAARLHSQDRDATMSAYASKIPPALRATWEKQYDIDPAATVEALKSMDDVVPLNELGHGGSDVVVDDGWFPQFSTTSREA